MPTLGEQIIEGARREARRQRWLWRLKVTALLAVTAAAIKYLIW